MILAIASPSFCKNQALCHEALALGIEVRFRGLGPVLEGLELGRFLHGSDYAIIGTEKIDASVLSHCPQLKGIAKYGVGLDGINFLDCERAGVEVRYTTGVNKTSVAELTMAFILSLAHRAHITSNLLKKGQWQKDGGRQLSTATVGLIGFGHVGQEVARMLMPFGSKILVTDILSLQSKAQDLGATQVELIDLLKNSDFISLHVPLTKETFQMINHDSLKLMKAGVCLVNTSRGNVMDLEAVKTFLDAHFVAGVAMDVYPEEPCQDYEFLNRPEVFCTPHIGGNSLEAVMAMGMAALSHVRDWMRISP